MEHSTSACILANSMTAILAWRNTYFDADGCLQYEYRNFRTRAGGEHESEDEADQCGLRPIRTAQGWERCRPCVLCRSTTTPRNAPKASRTSTGPSIVVT